MIFKKGEKLFKMLKLGENECKMMKTSDLINR